MRIRILATYTRELLAERNRGCNFFTNLLKDKRTDVSTVAPQLPAPPKPASLIKGTPEEQAVYFADQLASPETRLAGWLGLYDALGIPVIGQDGEPLDNERRSYFARLIVEFLGL